MFHLLFFIITWILFLVTSVFKLFSDNNLVRLRFLGKVLSVERASRPTENSKNQCETQVKKESTSSTNDAPLGKDPCAEAKIGSLLGSEPIAERLGVDYPFPPHLEYVLFCTITCAWKLFVNINGWKQTPSNARIHIISLLFHNYPGM